MVSDDEARVSVVSEAEVSVEEDLLDRDNKILKD